LTEPQRVRLQSVPAHQRKKEGYEERLVTLLFFTVALALPASHDPADPGAERIQRISPVAPVSQESRVPALAQEMPAVPVFPAVAESPG